MADKINKMSLDLEKLVEKAEIWQLLFDECPLAVAVFTADMKFFLINEEFSTMTGYSSGIIGNSIKLVLPDRVKKSHKKFERQYIQNPQKRSNRHGLSPSILLANKMEILVDIDLSYIKYDGKVYYVVFIRRITPEVL